MTASRELWAVGHLTVDDVIFWNGIGRFRAAGGAALYAAIGGSLLGMSAKVATRIGSGFPVTEFERLRGLGIELAPSEAREPCISQWVLYEEDGSRTFVLHPSSGSHKRMSPNPNDYRIPRSAAVHLAPMPVAEQSGWCKSAHGHHQTLTVDPHADSCKSDKEDVLGMAAYVDAFLPSELEARLLVDADPLEAVQVFREAGAPIAVIKLGAQGSIVATGDGIWHVPVVPVAVVDVTGAGDAYCGAFAAALSLGAGGVEAACAATAAASAVVEVTGTDLGSFAQARRQVAERLAVIQPQLISGDAGESIHALNQKAKRRT